MNIKTLLDHYADYDLWANSNYVSRLERGSADELDQPVSSSFPSLRLTVLHIRDAENAWYCRLTGEPMSWPAEADTSIVTLLKYAARLHELVHGYTDADLNGSVTYHDLKGKAYVQPRWHMLMHCFNHSTQHRGQLITIMRSLGLQDIPANDLIQYQRSLLT